MICDCVALKYSAIASTSLFLALWLMFLGAINYWEYMDFVRPEQRLKKRLVGILYAILGIGFFMLMSLALNLAVGATK